LPGTRRSPLGRETAIQKCVWGEDGWLRLAGGGPVPSVEVPAPGDPANVPDPARLDYEFDEPTLPINFQWLRTPYPERIFSLTERPGHLRLFGRESI
jgi:xylan 1,4-beta-xylosidase